MTEKRRPLLEARRSVRAAIRNVFEEATAHGARARDYERRVDLIVEALGALDRVLELEAAPVLLCPTCRGANLEPKNDDHFFCVPCSWTWHRAALIECEP